MKMTAPIASRRRRSPVMRTAVTALAVGLVLAACGPADEVTEEPAPEPEPEAPEPEEPEEPDEPEEGPLAGELITIKVGASAGGGYDSYARLIADFIGDELGADITVENEPGAGGLVMLTGLWADEPDGTTFAIMNGTGVVGSVLGGAEGIEFDVDQFSYIGRVAAEPQLVSVSTESEYESAEQLLGYDGPFSFSATGPGASTYINALLVPEALGMTNTEIIAGYEGGAEARVGVTAGEADGHVGTADSTMPEVDAGDHRPLVLVASDRMDELPDTPTLLELDLTDEGAQVAQAHIDIVEAGRILVAPPGVPDDILEALRQAVENLVNSEEFLAEAESRGLPIDFSSGAESAERIQSLIADARQVVRDALVSEDD